jgi:hypothetical protein
MRKLFEFVISVALVVGGLWLLADTLLFGERTFLRFLFAGVLPATLGIYLLWVDFVAPMLGIKTAKE